MRWQEEDGINVCILRTRAGKRFKLLPLGVRSERSGHVLAIFRRSSSGTWQLARSAKLIPLVDNPDRL